MLGWKQRFFFGPCPALPPPGLIVEGGPPASVPERLFVPLFGVLFTVAFCFGVRLLELPFWDFAGFYLNGEPLLGTHDAYHWVAGAEGFEFGAGHPMSELLRVSAGLLSMTPAEAAFYLPAFFGALTGAAVFLWGWGLGRPCAGIVAGVLSSLSPSFWGRTLLGYYDTDLVVLPFAVLLGLVPAMWLHPWLSSPADALFRRFAPAPGEPGVFSWRFASPAAEAGAPGPDAESLAASALSWPRVGLLILAGFLGYQTQAWHSLFPYLVRFSALLIPFLIVVFGPVGGRIVLLRGALCHALPLLLGLPGAVFAMLFALLTTAHSLSDGPFWLERARRILLGNRAVPLLWLGVIILAAADSDVGRTMYASFMSYAHRAGDPAATVAGGAALLFPSVSLSIIETQLVKFSELILHVYPNRWLVLLSMILFARRLFLTPAFWWFVPPVALFLLSVMMGGRMSMFGAPCLLLALCLDVFDLLGRLGARLAQHFGRWTEQLTGWSAAAGWARAGASLGAAILLVLLLVRPLMDIIPAVSQGPILTQSQAQALRWLKDNSAPDALVWNWWDWGYATHHFAMRRTIADGARHGGPSLFLPAAVYTTADPRFARQMIKYTALKGNEPGEVFKGLDAAGAQELMRRLGDKSEPLIESGGTQYVVVSLELLRLGVWVSQYGSWNFATNKSSGSYMNNLDKAIAYNLETGLVQPDGGKGLRAGSIAVFESGGLSVRRYPDRQGGFHFIFNPPRRDEEESFHKRFIANPLSLFWKDEWAYVRLAVESNDKIAMDEVFYNTLMVQLLLCDRDDPRFAPYFRLVYDNTYTRVFEVR